MVSLSVFEYYRYYIGLKLTVIVVKKTYLWASSTILYKRHVPNNEMKYNKMAYY